MSRKWTKLNKPILALAPMEGVTDTVFRRIVQKAGKPDVMFTEFISVEGLTSRGYPGMANSLKFDQSEQPLMAQIWGYTPDKYFQAASKLVDMGFAGIDINFGCPDRAVMKKGGGAKMIENPNLASKIIQAVKGAVGGRVPVSVKTRIGIDRIITNEWIGFLLDQDLDAITVHGRTAKELSKVPAHWEEIKKAVDIKNRISPKTIIIGNGDVESMAEAWEKVRVYGVDGVMIGRGVFKNPWVFDKKQRVVKKEQKLQLLQDHLTLFEKTWGERKPVFTLRKFFKIYCQGFPGAVDLRVRLMAANNLEEIRGIIQE